MMKKGIFLLFLLTSSLLIAEDNSQQGFSYRGSVDFTPEYYTLPHASYSFGLGLGCEGFNWEATFQSLLSGEAIKNYLQGTLQAVISASPMLLLEYASPTLADTLKHFQNRSQDLLHLNYITCEDIMKIGEGYLGKLRKENEAKTIQNQGGGNLNDAIASAKQDDTLQNIPDYRGNSIGRGGRLKVVQEGLDWAKSPKETKEVAEEIIGDVEILGRGELKYKEAKKTPNQLFVEYREYFVKNISRAVNYYISTGRVSQADLKKISLPAFPVEEIVIKSIGDLRKEKRPIAVGKLASTLAHLKLLSELNDLEFALTRAKQNPVITDTTKEILDQKILLTRTIKKNLNIEKETTEEYFAKTVNSIITEAEIDKVKAMGEVAGQVGREEPSPTESKWTWGGMEW